MQWTSAFSAMRGSDALFSNDFGKDLFCECRDAVRCETTASAAAASAAAACWTFHVAETAAESTPVCRQRARQQDDCWQPCHLVRAAYYCSSKGLCSWLIFIAKLLKVYFLAHDFTENSWQILHMYWLTCGTTTASYSNLLTDVVTDFHQPICLKCAGSVVTMITCYVIVEFYKLYLVEAA